MGRPRLAKAFRVGCEKTSRSDVIEGSFEKPSCDANASRSRAYSPIATAVRGVGEDVVLMIPKGRLAREKWHVLGIKIQDFAVMIASLGCATAALLFVELQSSR